MTSILASSITVAVAERGRLLTMDISPKNSPGGSTATIFSSFLMRRVSCTRPDCNTYISRPGSPSRNSTVPVGTLFPNRSKSCVSTGIARSSYHKPPMPDLVHEQQKLDGDEDDDRHFQRHRAAVSRQIDQQLQVVLNHAQLVIERAIAILDLERRAQRAVEAIERFRFPRRWGRVEQRERVHDLVARRHALPDELIELARRAAKPARLGQLLRDLIELAQNLLDVFLVILHRHRLRDDEREQLD